MNAKNDVPHRHGRPQGGMKSEVGRAAYWRMQYESAIQALADLIAENTENVEFVRDFYAHNADLMSDYWRAEFARVFPSATMTAENDAGCACEYPYLGAQSAGTPIRCERCRLLVLEDGRERLRLLNEKALRDLREWAEARAATRPIPPGGEKS